MLQKVRYSRRALAWASFAGVLGAIAFAPLAAHAEDITIGMPMKTHTELRWKFDEEIMKDEAAKLGDALEAAVG